MINGESIVSELVSQRLVHNGFIWTLKCVLCLLPDLCRAYEPSIRVKDSTEVLKTF